MKHFVLFCYLMSAGCQIHSKPATPTYLEHHIDLLSRKAFLEKARKYPQLNQADYRLGWEHGYTKIPETRFYSPGSDYHMGLMDGRVQ